jgi:NAD+ synthetase
MYHLTKEQIQRVIKKTAWSIFNYCRQNNICFPVTGSSGGLDSAVILALINEAQKIARQKGYPLYSIGVTLPCHSDPIDLILGRKAIQAFGTREVHVDLTPIYDFIDTRIFGSVEQQVEYILRDTAALRKFEGEVEAAVLERAQKIVHGNIKARLRMALGTYFVANQIGIHRGSMVMCTDNLSEYWMAFWTDHGDVGFFGAIQNLLKHHELYDIAKSFPAMPPEIIARKPTDGLGITSGDEEQLGPYEFLERTMIGLIQKGFKINGPSQQLKNLPNLPGIPKEYVQQTAKRCLNGAFKRRGSFTLTRRALGLPEAKNIKLD